MGCRRDEPHEAAHEAILQLVRGRSTAIASSVTAIRAYSRQWCSPVLALQDAQ